MAIRNLKIYADAMTERGGLWQSFIYKTGVPNVTVGTWADCSMVAGQPKYNAYVGNQTTATPFIGARNESIYLGPAGGEKYLHSALLMTGANTDPASFMLCDYLLFYPLIDLDSTDVQLMDNTLTLPRYEDGLGVKAMIVCTLPTAANDALTINYTDAFGNTIDATVSLVSTITGGILTQTPFANITNVVRINSVQLTAAIGGFACICLVKPLATMQTYEAGVPVELTFINQMAKAPRLFEGAALNLIALKGGAGTSGPLMGKIEIANLGA